MRLLAPCAALMLLAAPAWADQALFVVDLPSDPASRFFFRRPPLA